MEAAEVSGLQALVSQVASRYAKGGQSMSRMQSLGRLSFMSSGSLSTKTRRKNVLGNKQRDSLSLMAGETGGMTPNLRDGTMQSFLLGGRNSMAVDPNTTPQWLLDAASDMAAGGATAGHSTGNAGVFGASTGVGGGSGTAASQPIEISSGGLLHHVRSLLLLRPVALHDVWLRKAEHLIARGHYAAARRLLHRAQTLARASDHPEAEARALLVEAMAQSAANDFSGAIMLIQQAQRIGGDYDFWRETVSTYVHCRLSAPHTTTTDAREALQGGVLMFTIIARDDRAAEKDAMLAAASLKLQLSQLLLTDMLTMRANGVFNWKKHYDQAVSLCGQVMAALAAREAGIPHIEALLHQSLLQMEDPKPDKDMRPRYKKIERVLQQAEDMAAKFVTVAAPRDLEHSTSLPVSRLLARVRLALAGLRLMQARARDAHAAEDRNNVRPKYPLMATGSREEESVVVEFIDAMEGACGPSGIGAMMPPEDTALTLAISAAQLCNAPRLRARALLLAGQCLQYKYVITVPKSMQPWPPRERSERRRTVIGLGDLSASISSSSTNRSISPTRVAVQQAQKTGLPTIVEGRSDSPTPPGSGPVDLNSAPSAGPEDAAAVSESMEDEHAMVRADTYQGQAVSTLLEALECSLEMDHYGDAESCAHEIARCYGRRTKGTCAASAQYLCLAQACKAVAAAYKVTMDAQPPQSAEQLALKQVNTLREDLPRPGDSIHYQRVQATLAALGAPARLHQGLNVEQAKHVAQARYDASGGLPPDVRVISLYLSPNRQTLYFVALNVPDAAAAAEAEAAAAAAAAIAAEAGTDGVRATSAGKRSSGAKAGGRKDGQPLPAPLPRMAVVDAVPLEAELLDTLRGALRTYRRNAEKHIREGIKAAHERGMTNDSTHLLPSAPTAKGSGGSKASKAEAGGGKGGKGKGSKASAKIQQQQQQEQASASAASQRLFPPELNEEWEDILWRMDLIMSPFKLAFKATLPEAADSESKPKVVLLLDNELTGLPFEGIPALQNHCAAVSRATSLHTLRVAMQLPSSAELEQVQQQAVAAAAAAAGGTPEGGSAAAAAAAAAASAGAVATCAPPTFDLTHMTYIVDARCEGSMAEQASGPCSTPLIPWFKSSVLNQPMAKDWSGMLGSPGRVAPDADFSMLLEKANAGEQNICL
uniref:Uncharacterized protein n=1 Tax=Dunaliella tertiolecta TaxID=3047 RepID=A0A7S3QYI0_DUNTE